MYHSPVTLVILCTKAHVLYSSDKLSSKPCNVFKSVPQLVFGIGIALKLLPRRFGIAGNK